jgi:signal-transduction protein with cAMP-binding, CBS, and nucleotidyltransferase domain
MARIPHPSGTIPRIGQVMTPFPYSIDLERHAGDAERMLAGRSIHHLPVTSAGEVYSVLSARDLEQALARPGADPRKVGVRELCAKDPYIVDVADALDEVLSGMANRGACCAVVAHGDRVAGVFTSVDACRKFAEWLKEAHSARS